MLFKKNKKIQNLKKLIERSGLFDKVFYLKAYSDVRRIKMLPIEHYVKYGIKEDRKPNATFDPVWYREYYTDVKNYGVFPLVHFIKFGRKENRFQSEIEKNEYEKLKNDGIDVNFYKNSYVDLQNQDISFDPILHYVRHGKNEGREHTRLQKNIIEKHDAHSEEESTFQKDYDIIKSSNLFDVNYYLETYPDINSIGIDPIEHYIIHGALEGRNPNEEFDTSFYLKNYPDVDITKINPLVHYLLYGKKENRMIKRILAKFVELKGSLEDLSVSEQDEYKKIRQLNLDWTNYFDVNTYTSTYSDPITDYVKNWKVYESVVPNFFDTMFYLMCYPDIRDANINPLLHYMYYGKNEGRVGFFDKSKIELGKLQFDSQKETIVFVSHESSATGAPLLGYGIANKLSEKYNIVHIVLKKANIHDAFLSSCDLILHDVKESAYLSSYYFLNELLENRSIKCVIINSIVGYQTMYAAYKLNLPIVFLIHEFAEYMRPFGAMIDAVLYSDYVVTPAKIIQNSILKEFKRFTNYKEVPANMSIYPQGKLPYIPDTYGEDDSIENLYERLNITDQKNVKIIVGSGWVQIRKGLDLFIAVAKYIKKLYKGECRFVWVGEGFDPDNDLAYSIYLEREIEFSGLGSDFVFLEHQKNLDNIFSIANVFCLTSRMDPFPNVVIDALAHDLHVACFEHGSGSAEFLQKHNANATVVDFVDTYEMAKAISLYLENRNDKKGVNKEVLKEHLDFNKYVAYIDELIEKAVAFKTESKIMTEKLLSSDLFDADYCGGDGDAVEKCRRYVEYGLKGIHFYNPKIGFSEIDWLEKHSKSMNAVVPLYEAMKSQQIETHKVVALPCKNKGKINFRYAVHLHLYYIDMASYFASYFKNLPHSYDLYITIVEEEAIEKVKEKFSECGASLVKVVCVENIGRDMGPLLFRLKDEILSDKYDVVGHFHSKKSLDLETGGGDKWLEYLMQHLVGDKNNARSVLSIFNDPSVGLVFPEDTNTSDIGENKEFLEDLCKILQLPIIEQTPIFPMGNMFWAKVDALKELFYLDENVILQPEPLPYDGSYMHAIERITPYLIKKNGYEYMTVYKEGMSWK